MLDVLVAAFRKAFADKEYLAVAAKANHTLQPLPPTEFYKASEGMFNMTKGLEAILKPAR